MGFGCFVSVCFSPGIIVLLNNCFLLKVASPVSEKSLQIPIRFSLQFRKFERNCYNLTDNV